MEKKSKIAIFFGGQSGEHQISLLSAKNVIESLDRSRYAPVLIGINYKGEWHLYDEQHFLVHEEDPEHVRLGNPLRPFSLFEEEIDLAFPVLHGTNGEDGTVQGYIKLAGIPTIGAGVLASAIGMDKEVAKRLIKEAGIPTAEFLSFSSYNRQWCTYENICKAIAPPFFVKPSNSGSSLGISKVSSAEEFSDALETALEHDPKVLVEEAIEGIELQVGIVGNETLTVSLPCQIMPKGAFHTYASKYIDADGAQWDIPAPIGAEKTQEVQELARQIYRILCCEGFARVDLFLGRDGTLWFNEINTIPGLTDQSPFAKMFAASGIVFSDLLEQIINTHRVDSVPVYAKP